MCSSNNCGREEKKILKPRREIQSFYGYPIRVGKKIKFTEIDCKYKYSNNKLNDP